MVNKQKVVQFQQKVMEAVKGTAGIPLKDWRNTWLGLEYTGKLPEPEVSKAITEAGYGWEYTITDWQNHPVYLVLYKRESFK